MKIVIDISDENYKKIKKAYTCIFGDIYYIMQGVIANGTPLPKGHGRLIDTDALEVSTVTTDDYSGNETLNVVLLEDIENAPTIIEADRSEEDG